MLFRCVLPLRWLIALVLCASTTWAAQPFLESGGRVVMEVESAPVVGSWTSETYQAGYTGSVFYEWKKGDPNLGIDGAGSGTMSYPITIATAGRYRIQIRGRPAHSTDYNDVWVRVLGATKVEAVRTDGSDLRNLGNAWTKAYNNDPSNWSWTSWTVDNDPHAIYADFTAGAAATVELSGRSTQFKVDRIVLYTSAHTEAQATSTALPESPRGGTAIEMPAASFPQGDPDYRWDAANGWRFILPPDNAGGTSNASISQTFPGPAGTYTVALHAVGENDGRSTYGLVVGGTSYGTYQPPLSSLVTEEGPTFVGTFANVVIANGATVTIDGTIGTNGTDYARARWSKLVFTPAGGTGGTTPTMAVSGELKQWHKVTLTLDGPAASEGGSPNPFTDYRYDVTFSNGSLTYAVPGYFAADGNAGETSATAGTKWRAHLSPDLTGTWTWTVAFRQGTNVAQNGGGSNLAPYHGLSGSFTIAASDKTGRDFRGKGRLEYVGQRYLRHKGNGEWFIKSGADAPENFLNNTEIDGTVTQSGTDRRHSWSAHVGDWQNGDPVWQSTKGKGAIGAINYLASTGSNVFSFLTMNVDGDSKDVWPYVASNQRTRMDCSKLDQWEVLFAHADRQGMYLHFKTQEIENNNLLDGGNLGLERKLYYRELVARFGHHLALNWNLGEENRQTEAQRKAMAQWFYDNDPYRHLVVLHTWPGEQNDIYRPLLGAASKLSGVSIQTGWNEVHGQTRQWIDESGSAGRHWVVANDEQGDANDGIPPQPGWTGYSGGGPTRAQLRHQTLWGNLMAGGAGVEAYFGYSHPESDLSCRNWRSRADWWAMGSHALTFFRTHLPFTIMSSQDPLVGNSSSAGNARYCFAKTGEIYAVYVQAGLDGTATLDLAGQTGTWTVQWYNPRAGGTLQSGALATVTGGGSRALGAPPADASQDWVILVRRQSGLLGDANGDGVVNGSDLALVQGQFGRSGAGISSPGADLDGNARVDAVDLGIVTQALGN